MKTATWKNFLLSLLATTISIVLTFGITAIINHKNERKEKRELVMMVMYDMSNSLQEIESVNSNLRESFDLQIQIAEDTSLFDYTTYLQLFSMVPMLNYNETVEHIFSSSIESINTIGNVLFVENVSEFYNLRRLYQTMICDSSKYGSFETLESVLDNDYSQFIFPSEMLYQRMKQSFVQCQQMMNISDEEIETYRKQREEMDEEMRVKDITGTITDSLNVKVSRLSAAKKKLNLL
ncbi:MAG: hypothetical protein IJR04_04710 [Bacteroidales bacterium]|nr:hypothetical protein [Bacteroidales bacterium]